MQGNEQQNKAIVWNTGPTLILAGPGSGKTFTTVERVRYLIEIHHVDPSNILVITFTRAAARQMRDRFFARMEGVYHPVTFGTFHAVFFQILKTSCHYESNCIVTEREKREYLRTLLQNMQGEFPVQEDWEESLLSEIGFLKNRGSIPEGFQSACLEPEAFRRLFLGFQRMLSEMGKLDLDDFAAAVRHLFLTRPAALREWQQRFSYLLVDEFQDINETQYAVMKLLAGEKQNLFVVGDDDQAIYGFRGSDPSIMRQFAADFPNAVQISLSVNYRSRSGIVERAGKLIAANKERFPKRITAGKEEGTAWKFTADPDSVQRGMTEYLSAPEEAGVRDNAGMHRDISAAGGAGTWKNGAMGNAGAWRDSGARLGTAVGRGFQGLMGGLSTTAGFSAGSVGKKQERPPAWTSFSRDGSVQLCAFADRRQQARALAWMMQRFRQAAGKSPVPSGSSGSAECAGKIPSIAAIFRTNSDAALLAEALGALRVPFVMREKLKSPYSHPVCRDLLAYLEFAMVRRERDLFFRIMNRPCRYLSRQAVTQTQVSFPLLFSAYRDKPYMMPILTKLQADIGRMAGMDLYAAVNFVRKGMGYDGWMKKEMREEQYREAVEAADFFQDSVRGFSTVELLKEHIERYEQSLSEAAKKDPETDPDAVCLTTMHGSKGLEFDIVFLPDCNEGIVPHKKSLTGKELEEERRMFYVGMTRAKERLYLSWVGGTRAEPGFASRFLSDCGWREPYRH